MPSLNPPDGSPRADRSHATEDLQRLRQALAAQYDLEGVVGRGGTAVVYRAFDRRHQRPVAIKVLRSRVGSILGPERFVREIRLTAQLQHPHILALYDSGDAGAGLLYYVMPFVGGESLRDSLDREGRLPIGEALRTAREVADALAFAHDRKIVHRDIKPGNVLCAHGHAMVADFGIARALEAARTGEPSATTPGGPSTEAGVAVGTPGYMSPEQRLDDGTLDGRSDVYSLGCVLFEMLTGQLPYEGAAGRPALGRTLLDEPPAASALRPEVPGAVDRLLGRALMLLPEQRFASAREFRDALDGALRAFETSTTERARTAAFGSAPANLGPCVARTCDRWQQVNAFDAGFRSAHVRAPGRTQFVAIHGEEGQGHESLVERLVATRLAHYATEIGGEEGGTVLTLKVAWPSDADLEIGKRDLAIALFREAAPGYIGEDLSAAALARLVAHARSPIVAVQHDIRAARWAAGVETLMRWYVDAFWGAYQSAGGMPHFVVFLKVTYPAEAARRRFAAWLRRPPDKREAVGRLARLFETTPSRCPATVLGELTPVTLEDVQDWFRHNNIYDSEHHQRELAATIFRTSSVKPLAEVELALQRIHTEFVRRATRQHRSPA